MERKPDKAVLAAIAAAVTSYMKIEDQSFLPAAVMAAATPGTSGVSLYAASGRQQMMEMRRLLSLRMARR